VAQTQYSCGAECRIEEESVRIRYVGKHETVFPVGSIAQVEITNGDFSWLHFGEVPTLEGTFDSMTSAHGSWQHENFVMSLVPFQAQSVEGKWTASYVGSDCIKGDVNSDGDIGSNDAIIALQIAAGLVEATTYQECAADMNGDGKVISADAILILRMAAGFDSQ
jgi:hypothetical protein